MDPLTLPTTPDDAWGILRHIKYTREIVAFFRALAGEDTRLWLAIHVECFNTDPQMADAHAAHLLSVFKDVVIGDVDVNRYLLIERYLLVLRLNRLVESMDPTDHPWLRPLNTMIITALRILHPVHKPSDN